MKRFAKGNTIKKAKKTDSQMSSQMTRGFTDYDAGEDWEERERLNTLVGENKDMLDHATRNSENLENQVEMLRAENKRMKDLLADREETSPFGIGGQGDGDEAVVKERDHYMARVKELEEECDLLRAEVSQKTETI
eukprot:Polyplicarium_translucidae@DN5639_c0_g1_i1.p1